MVERAAFYEERVTTVEAGIHQEQQHIATRLSNEYLNLRIALVSISEALVLQISYKLGCRHGIKAASISPSSCLLRL